MLVEISTHRDGSNRCATAEQFAISFFRSRGQDEIGQVRLANGFHQRGLAESRLADQSKAVAAVECHELVAHACGCSDPERLPFQFGMISRGVRESLAGSFEDRRTENEIA